jgi:hypothetical protein
MMASSFSGLPEKPSLLHEGSKDPKDPKVPMTHDIPKDIADDI